MLLIWLLCGIVCAIIAGSKNRSAVGWCLIGLLIGIFGVILIACLPKVEQGRDHEAEVSDERRRLLELEREVLKLRQQQDGPWGARLPR